VAGSGHCISKMTDEKMTDVYSRNKILTMFFLFSLRAQRTVISLVFKMREKRTGVSHISDHLSLELMKGENKQKKF